MLFDVDVPAIGPVLINGCINIWMLFDVDVPAISPVFLKWAYKKEKTNTKTWTVRNAGGQKHVLTSHSLSASVRGTLSSLSSVSAVTLPFPHS